MASGYEMGGVVGGLFKIRGETVQSVLALTEEWSKAVNSNGAARFVYLAVRDCTGDDARETAYMVAIDFLYVLPNEKEPEREHTEFFHKYTDQLRRRFGNGLARWDVSTPVHVVRLTGFCD
jgi:hypothetical protein